MEKVKKFLKKIKRSQAESAERSARRTLIEELFYDFHRSRAQVYVMNLIRGIMFGAGSVIGGTLVIALLIWVLSLLANVITPLDGLFNGISSTLETSE